MHELLDTLATLQQLLSAANRAIVSLREAALQTRSPRMHSLCESRAAEWTSAAAPLQALRAELDDASRATTSSSPVSDSSLLAPPIGELLARCECTDDAAIAAWADALGEDLPPRIHRLLRQQYAVLKRDEADWRRWLDAKGAA